MYEKDQAAMPGEKDRERCSLTYLENEIDGVIKKLRYAERKEAEDNKQAKAPNVGNGGQRGDQHRPGAEPIAHDAEPKGKGKRGRKGDTRDKGQGKGNGKGKDD